MHRARWQWLLAVCALWVAGCTCGKPPVESVLTVAFEQPVDGQRLAQGDDADPAAEGFQYDVVARAADSAGRVVTLSSAKLEVQVAGESAWREGPVAVLDGQRVRFPGVTLPGRTNVLRVTVEEQGSKRTATSTQSVTVGVESWSVDLIGPTEGQVLREADDVDPATPGYQVRFKLRTSGLAGRTGTLFCGNACGIPTADFVVAPGGTTEVPVTLTEAACEAQVAECYAVVRYGSRDVASPKRSFTLDSVAPRVELSEPVAPVASKDFKVQAVVGCCEDGTVATLSREGQTPLSATVSGGVVSFPEVSVPGEGRFPYTLRVTDSGGNPVERPFEVVVASSPYVLELSAPATVSADMDVDGDASNGIQVDVTATTSASEPTTMLEFYTAVTTALGTPVRVATTASASGGRTATFRASLAEGNNAVRVCVRNPALPDSCQSRTVSVSTGRGSCRIVSPLPGAVVASSTLPVQVETGADSVKVYLRDASGTETRTTGIVSGGDSWVDVALPSDGDYRLVASCGTSGVSQSLTVRRDIVSPELLISVSSEDGDSGVLGPQTRDTSALPGTQVIVTARTEPFATVALTGCDPSNNVIQVADASGLAVLREVTVPRTGACSLSLTATDVASNSTVKQKALVLGLTGAQLALVAPAAGRALGAADGTVRAGGGLTVEARVSVSAGSSGVLRLFLGTREVGSVTVEAADSAQEKVFSGVELNEGANVLRATLTSTTGVAACATELLTVDTATRTLSLVLPSRTTRTLNLVSDRNSELPGIQAPLQYVLSGAAVGGRVDICTSIPLTTAATPCRDGSGFFTLATDVPSFVANFHYPDGEYALKAVLDDASFTDTEPLPLVVDSVRPRVTRIVLENDTGAGQPSLAGDGQLNVAELSGGDPVVSVSVSGLEDGRMVQVRDASGVTLFGQAPVTGGLAHVSLSGLPSPEANYSLVAVVTDTAGNGNKLSSPTPLDPLNNEAFAQFRLDRVAPALELSSPTKAVLGPADDADAADGFQIAFSAVTSGDVGSEGVVVDVSPLGVTRKLTPSSLKVSDSFTVPPSGTTTYTFRIQVTDEAGNTTTTTRSVTVDFDPPGLEPVSPMAGTVQDSSIVSLRANVTGAEGRTVNVYSIPKDGSAPSLIAALTVGSDGVASGSANLLFGTQDVRFEVRDVAGNLTTATVPNVTVTFVGCDQRFTKPSGTPVSLVQKDDLQPAVADLQYRIEGVTGVCKGRQVRLFRGSATTPEATTVADATTGAFSFDVTLPDGVTTPLRLEMDDGATSTSVSADIFVDVSAPVLSNVVPAATTLFYVADSNETVFQTPRPANYIMDLAPDGDAEADLSLRITGARNGSVRVLYKGVDLVKPEVVPDADDKSLVLRITLPNDSSGTLEIVARDALGNEVRRTANVTVDVQPPAAPTVNANVVAGAERTASVAVNWTTVGDDGASGTPSGYDLRWTTPIVQAGGITTDTIFFSNKVKQASGALLPSSTTSFTLTPLPPLTTYSLQVRARDEVGNYSRIATPVSVDNFLRNRDVTNPGAGTAFGFLVGAGDLDGVAGDDLVVANYDQSSNRGVVYVYSGADLLPAGGGPAVVTQTLLPPDSTAQFFGVDFGIGNAGDVAGEGKADLLVGASGWNGNLGRAFLYFGRSGAGVKGVDPTPLEFRGSVAGGRLGVTARIIGDIDKDGIGEVVLSSSYESGGVGRVYLFLGRTRAKWNELLVDSASPTSACTAASTSCFIPASKADRIFEGDSAATTNAPNTFGRTRGLVSLGDITSDGYGDFMLPASRDTWNRAYLHSGKAVLDATSSIPVTATLQTLTQPVGTDRNRFDGFGTEACAGVNLVGGPGLDLVLSHPVMDRLLVYGDGTKDGYGSVPTLTIQGSSNFGNGLSCADINGDSRLDLVVGTNPSSSGWSVWVLYNQGTAGAEFEPALGGFSQAQILGAKSLGVSVATGDFNGDRRPDIAAGSNLDPAGSRVRIWY